MISSYRDRERSAWQPERRSANGNRFGVRLRNACVSLDAATSLGDLGALNSNRLEALKGNRKGQYSIRINAQWRICFN